MFAGGGIQDSLYRRGVNRDPITFRAKIVSDQRLLRSGSQR
jgi:hypothetical protein